MRGVRKRMTRENSQIGKRKNALPVTVGRFYNATYSGIRQNGAAVILSHACLPVPARPHAISNTAISGRNYTVRYAYFVDL